VDVLVADTTDDQGLATARGHLLAPSGPFGPSPDVQVLEAPNMMHFDTIVRPAHLAGIGEQTLVDLTAPAVPASIVHDSGRLSGCP
jgi:hypothetical protein